MQQTIAGSMVARTEMADGQPSAAGIDHPLRRVLHDELHARPSIYFSSPADVWHVSLLGAAGEPEDLARLLQDPDAVTSPDGKHGIAPFGAGRIKWERHTEFTSLTFVVEGRPLPPGAPPPSEFTRLAQAFGGSRVAASHVLVVDRDDAGAFLGLTEFADSAASRVGGGDAGVWSDFRLGDNGFVTILVVNEALNSYRAGRIVRRLIEIETYRMMALLGLPLARDATPKIVSLETRLDELMKAITEGSRRDEELLSQVTNLASEIISFIVRTTGRFSATAAYAELVAERITELREDRIDGRQRLGVFIKRRFGPAVRTCATTGRRLETLSRRIAEAGNLLSTTVQVELQQQNATLLASMERRTEAQLRIQQAVEGLSVIAISYYLIALFKTGLDSAIESHLAPAGAKAATLIALPVVVLAVWRAVRGLRRASSG